ncbi:MAG TPA: phosphatase PAP2 family protein, partial [Fimbriimonadaceae bacterium]|nr:phosphatase PAP2 family protein [Fimbriimonadaceae bacterium]
TEFGANSFPSGHTTTAFAIAFLLFLMTRKKECAWVGQVALGWAVLVGVSRVYRGVHWPTDVIGGAFAGLFSACLIYLLAGLKKEPTAEDE